MPLSMGIGKQANLNQGHWNRGITPWLELASIDGDCRYAFNTFGPLASLFVVLKLTTKKNFWAVVIALCSMNQPAFVFYSGARTRRRHANTGGWEPVL